MTEKIPVLSSLASSDEIKEYPLSSQGHSFRVFSSIESVGDDWEIAQPQKNIYLQRPILQAIELAPPKGIVPTYLIFYKNSEPIGVAYCQVMTFKTNENVQDMEGRGALKNIGSSIKGFLAKRLEYKLLVCGNLLFTGEHGHHFIKGSLGGANEASHLDEALKKTQLYWKEKKVKIDGVFIKDIGDAEHHCRKDLLNQSFREFLFHPNMVLYVRPHWHSFEDYMQDISSKYRVRAKKAFKCGKGLERIELDAVQLKSHVDRLYELYQGVMLTAGFNMVVLHENYIVKLKENLGDRFKVTGYYIDGELIGYRTNIHNYDELEAHFLGYDQSFNRNYQVYMNMLLDSLKLGISNKVKRIVFARTAMEIKSTIGAVPEDLYCYIRANNKLMNFIMAPILEYFRPADDWVQRRPFKDAK
ncbi:MAG: hypothetical protein AAFZ15_05115 [Bacteroidota bacterium]